jgi:hypothetical protein
MPVSSTTVKTPMFENLVIPGDYVYTKDIPRGCQGKRYRLHRIIMDVPTYQRKLLLEALEGPDEGLWFTVTKANFETRYKLADNQPEVSVDLTTMGSGF